MSEISREESKNFKYYLDYLDYLNNNNKDKYASASLDNNDKMHD